MNKNILITFASKYGATQEIAEIIGEELNGAGCAAQVRPIKDVENLSAYEAVILGSAVYMGQWKKEAVSFLQANEKLLA